MASILDKKVVKDDKKFIYFLIAILILNIWFFSAPAKRLAQISIFNNSVRYRIAKISHDNSLEEYMYHRNNAVYLVQLKSKKRTLHAIKEMDKAIATIPDYVAPNVLQDLYKDRAYIKLYAGDKKGALDDLLLSGELNMVDNLKAASLLIDRGAYGLARKNCYSILNENSTAISGYVCLAYVYDMAGKPNSAMKILDYAIATKKPSNPKLYVERALLKQKQNDYKGYEEDIAVAKSLLPNIDITTSMMTDAINPKEINLTVQ